MKLSLIILLFFMVFGYVQAEEKDSLLQAYQRELTHLSSQKIQLTVSLKDLAKDYHVNSQLIKAELAHLSKDLAQLQISNEGLAEQLQIQGKDFKMNINSKSQLEILWKRINGGISKVQDFVELQKESSEKTLLPENLNLLGFTFVKNAVMITLTQSTHINNQDIAYYAQNGNLVESEVIRWGSLAAFAKNGDELSLLAPTEQSVLQILPLKNDYKFSIAEKIKKGAGAFIPMYLFDSLSENSQFVKPASFADQIMSMLPAVLLLGLFLLVISLFINLARH